MSMVVTFLRRTTTLSTGSCRFPGMHVVHRWLLYDPMFVPQHMYRLSSSIVSDTSLSDDDTFGKNHNDKSQQLLLLQSNNVTNKLTKIPSIKENKRQQQIQSIMDQVRDICNNEIKYPLGSLLRNKQQHDGMNVHQLLHSLVSTTKNLVYETYGIHNDSSKAMNSNSHQNTTIKITSVNTTSNDDDSNNGIACRINLCLQLLDRLCREPREVDSIESSTPKTNQKIRTLCKPHIIHDILQLWKTAALQNESVLSVMEVSQILQRVMTSGVSSVRHNMKTIPILLDVAKYKTPDALLPSVLSKLWDSLEQSGILSPTNITTDESKQISKLLYDMLMTAHAECSNNVEDTINTMYDVMDIMQDQRNIKPTVDTYNILLQYIHQNCNHIDTFDYAIQLMESEQILPNINILHTAIQCYTSFDRITLPIQYFYQLIDLHTETKTDINDTTLIILQDAQLIMNTCLKLVKTHYSASNVNDIVAKVDQLYNTLDDEHIIVDDLSKQQLLQTMMEIYGQTGNLKLAYKRLLKVPEPLLLLYETLIHSCCSSRNIVNAIDVLRSLLNDHRVTPNIQIFNALLNECAKSTLPVDEISKYATDIVTILLQNERCLTLHIEPSRDTYNIMLLCMMKSSSQYASHEAFGILLEMENRCESDPSLLPDMTTFHRVIQICIQVNDKDCLDEVVERYKNSNVPIDIQLYNTILNYYARISSYDAAVKAETILVELFELGNQDISIRPNVYTFNIVLNAWARSKDAISERRMWIIYKQMIADGIDADDTTYETMITHFSKSVGNIPKAVMLLQRYEKDVKNPSKQIQPSFTNYDIVIKKYLKYNDIPNAMKIIYLSMDMYMNGYKQIVPTTQTYSHIVRVWIKHGGIVHATAFVEKIQRMFDDGKLPEPPNDTTHLLLYNVWRKTPLPEKEEYLTKMKARIDHLISKALGTMDDTA